MSPKIDRSLSHRFSYRFSRSSRSLLALLRRFFNDGRRTRLELISSFIERLKSFLAAMEAARPDFDFIASSVLLIYEGSYDRSSLREKHVRPMLDHTFD